MSSVPRLTVELVPLLAWRQNVRSVVATDTWEGLRWHLGATLVRPQFLKLDLPCEVFRDGLKCAYCESHQKTLDLHEVWHYDDEKQV